MSLSTQVIDRLFDRLSATYGRDFMSRWEGLDGNAVKTSWAHELDGYGKRLDAIAWALENLPERAPNVIEFRNLCQRAPALPMARLPAPAPDPERVAAELAKLQSLRAVPNQPMPDGRQWARAIMERSLAGDRISPTVLCMARTALRMEA